MKIQLKRSNIENKAPTSEQMAYGELAVNYNDNAPCIYLKKEDGSIVKIAGAGGVGTGSADITLTAGDGLEGGGTFTLADQSDVTIDLDVDLAADKGLAFHSGELGLVDGNSSGDVLRWTGTAWAPAQQDNDDTTYALSDEAISNGGQINIDGSDGSKESFTIVGSGDTTVTHAAGGITISSTNTAAANDAEITITKDNGDVIDSFTLNQASDQTIALPAGTTDTNTTYTFTAIGNADPNTSALRLTAGGDGTGDQDIALVGAGGLVITQTDEGTLTFTQGTATGGTQDLQDVTDEGSNTTNGITIDTDKIVLNADGSAEFAGGDIELNSDGSAEFAGEVRSDSIYRVGSTGTNPDTHGVISYNDTENSVSLLVAGEVASEALTVLDGGDIRGGGKATFAGAVTAAEFNPGATGAGNFRIDLLPNISTAPKA